MLPSSQLQPAPPSPPPRDLGALLNAQPSLVEHLSRLFSDPDFARSSPAAALDRINRFFLIQGIVLEPEMIVRILDGLKLSQSDTGATPARVRETLENAGLEKEKFPLLSHLMRENGRLRRGEGRSETVAALQDLLKSHGYRIEDGNGRNRGIYGLQTERAVKKFQRENGLAASGVADAATLRALLEKQRESFKFGQGVNPSELTGHSRKILRQIMDRVGIATLKITSMFRGPFDQARVMYDNLIKYHVMSQRRLYRGNPGALRVIDVFERMQSQGNSPVEIKSAMQRQIEIEGPINISKHASDPNELNVIDISPSSIPTGKRALFIRVLEELQRQGVIKFIPPPRDPAFHIEIKQP